MIEKRGNKFFCGKCFDYIDDVVEHLRHHGVWIPPNVVAHKPPSQKPPRVLPPEILNHIPKLDPILKKAAANPHNPDPRGTLCMCDDCKILYNEVSQWYVDYNDLNRKYGMNE